MTLFTCSKLCIADKTVKAMKLTVLFLTAAFLQVSATGTAQKVSYSGKNVPLKTVFNSIERQTGYVFFYNNKDVKNTRALSIDLHDVSLEEALNVCLQNQSLNYVIKGNTIFIKARNIPVISETDHNLVTIPPPIDIKGKVVNEQGVPMSDVTVLVKGTKLGTKTDAQGRFSLNNVDQNAVLEFTYVGFVPVDRKVSNNMDDISITMVQKDNALSDLVMVGYGTSRRKDLTGSVASVNINEVKNTPFVSIDQALTGKAPGVEVTQADGSPGGIAKIRIRGGTSLLGGNDPLYVIDGIPVTIQNRYLQSAAEIVSPIERMGNDNPNNTISGSFTRGLNSLAGLNIDDIESIDILKDASATAIYGSKAANGVIIITTKKGKQNQKPVFEANYYAGSSVPIKEKLLTASQYTAVMKEGAQNLNAARAALGRPADPIANQILTNPSYLGTANTDWLGLVLRNGFSQNADISVRGGGTASRYFTSLSYTGQQGTVVGTDFERIAGKINLDNEITSRFRVISNLDYGFTKNNITNGMYTQALYMPPTIPAYNPDGTVYVVSPSSIGAYGYQGYQNPLLLLNGINKSNTSSLLGSLAGEYDILRSLKFKSLVSVSYSNYHQDNYTPSTALVASANGTSTTPGVATQGQTQDLNTFFENTLTWDEQLNKDNRINVLVGTSWQKTSFNTFSASGQGFPNDKYLNTLASAALALPPTSAAGQSSLLSFYSRANYALKEKYLFTFTGRADISSKFPKENRVGYFPSGGVAWKISQEKFLRNVHWLNELKLRASAGTTGTQNIGDNLFYTLYSPVSYAGRNGLVPSQLGNDELNWEKTFQKDAGVDIAAFNSRFRIAFGLYDKTTDGVLYSTAVANSSGYSSLVSNIAKIENKGLELDLRGDVVRTKDFQWTAAMNVSRNKSNVLSISNDLVSQSNGIVKFGNTALQVGKPLGLIYGREFLDIIKTQKQLDDYKAANLLARYGLYPYLGIGDAMYLLDNTGYFKDTVIGNAEPKFFGGFTNTFNYKNFSLIALLTYSYGADLIYLSDIQYHDLATRANKSTAILDHYSANNTVSNNPRLVLGQSSYAYLANNNVFNSSYLKLKSVTLNYDFSSKVLGRANIRSASIYLSATNLFTITKYPGPDPEVTNDPYSVIGGYSDVGGYPTVKQFNAGVRIGF